MLIKNIIAPLVLIFGHFLQFPPFILIVNFEAFNSASLKHLNSV